MRKRLELIFEKIENTPITFSAWLLTFFSIVFVRLILENFFTGFPFHFADHYFYFFSDFFTSFLFSLLFIILVLRWSGKISFAQASNLGLVSLLVIWVPPIIDEVISSGTGLLSFYCFDSLSGLWHRYLHFFGDRPDVGITYGVRAEIALAVLFAFVYSFIKTHSLVRSLFASFFLYTGLFGILALPSLVAIPLLGIDKGFFSIQETDIAAFMLTPQLIFGLAAPSIESVLNIKITLLFTPFVIMLAISILFVYFPTHCLALARNARVPQIFYHLGLFLIGSALVFVYSQPVFVVDIFHLSGLFILGSAIILAWLASVIVNDLNDTVIDQITNPTRPLIQNTIPRSTYITFGWLFFFSSLFLAAIISTQLALLLLAYQALAWIYSAKPLRLKRFPGIATILAASASLLIFFGGYIVFSINKNISELPWTISALLFFAYTVLLPIKDFKDIPGDAKDGVITLPILWGEIKAKRVIGSLAFLCFIVSVFVLNVEHLFLLAFFFGSLAYWLLQVSSKDHRYFSYHHLAGWYIALITGYTAFLVLHFLTR